MSERTSSLLAVPRSARNKIATEVAPSSPSIEQVVVGKDVLELLSTSMYVDPMTIYREYVQNAADAIDAAQAAGMLRTPGTGRVAITVDPVGRSIRMRDNGTGIPSAEFSLRLCSLGASAKRGAGARGFRGVGRLAGLGYCQELIFRSRAPAESHVSELRWDCRGLKAALRSADSDRDLRELVREVVSVHWLPGDTFPERFFDVELNGVVRHRNDRLLNPEAVADYLAQVAPLPFSPDFQFGPDVSVALRPHVRLGEIDVRINGAENPLYRPHRDRLEVGEGLFDDITDIKVHEIVGIDGGIAAIAWIAHHGYLGAIPNRANAKGLRLRTGNMQVGDHALLEELFPEPRFNVWAVGEIHIIDPRVLPNGRRDHFEQTVHFDNALNQLAPIARDIARRCRQSSITRKWFRDFELHEANVIERAKLIARGGLSRPARQVQADAIAKSLAAMRKVATVKNLTEEERSALAVRAAAIEARVSKLLGTIASAPDPLVRFKPEARSAIQRVIGLIYEYSTNRGAASALVDKILSRLEVSSKTSVKAERPQPQGKSLTRRSAATKASRKK